MDIDQELDDLSQLNTQTQDSSISWSQSQIPSNGSQDHVWGQLYVTTVSRHRLGRNVLLGYKYTNTNKVIDLTKDVVKFGRKGVDICVADLGVFPEKKIGEVSNIHFTLRKNNVHEAFCPVFLEDSSTNGTYIVKNQKESEMRLERIDLKVKRRILRHNDIICIEKKPTIGLRFIATDVVTNDFPIEIDQEYHIGAELGRGACGSVHFVQDRLTCKPYALKYTKGDLKKVRLILREVDILKHMKHPCILHLSTIKTNNDSAAIFLDFMKGGDLNKRMQARGPFSEALSKFLFYQICCGTKYLHSQNVTHRDLKPENILLATVDDFTLVKISDFGLSKRIQTDTVLATQCGTIFYLAPEVLSGDSYTNKVDIWSLGVVLFNCLSNCYPYRSHEDVSDGFIELKLRTPYWKNVTHAAKTLIAATLSVNVANRPSIDEVLAHDWLSPEDTHVQYAQQRMDNEQR